MSDKEEEKKTTENNPEVKEEKEISEEEKKENIKIKVGTIGTFLLGIFAVILLGTGALTYYLIHTEKESYDQQYVELTSNVPDENNEVNTIADMIDGALGTNIVSTNSVTTDSSTSRKTLNEELVVLYNGLILDTEDYSEQTLKYIDNTNDDADKYVITYYNYENFAAKDFTLGMLSSQLFEGLVKIDNVGKVAISEDFNAIPRGIKVVNTIPTIVSDNNAKVNEYNSTKVLIVDLDGNGTDEYILVLANKNTGFSKITLVDSKGIKIADLASIEKSKWKKDTTRDYYLSINNIDIVDIDNDGIMEVLIEIPQPTTDSHVSLVKYNNGDFKGSTNIEISLIAE